MSAVGFGVGALMLGLVMWVYFEAADREKNAVLWALATVLTFGLAAALWLVVRNNGRRREVVAGAAARVYLYVAWFCGAFLVSLGLSVGVGNLLYGAFADSGITSDVRDVLASGIVAAAVGFVVMFTHWSLAERRLDGLPDAEFRAQFVMRRLALQTLVFVNGLTAVLAALALFGGALSELLGASYAYAAAWVPAVAPFFAAGAMTAYGWKTWSTTDHGAQAERAAAISAPPTVQSLPSPPQPQPGYSVPEPAVWSVPAPTPPQTAPATPPRPGVPYCGHCGARITHVDDVFCRECGTQLAAGDASTRAS